MNLISKIRFNIHRVHKAFVLIILNFKFNFNFLLFIFLFLFFIHFLVLNLKYFFSIFKIITFV
jgi:hypothetical protein